MHHRERKQREEEARAHARAADNAQDPTAAEPAAPAPQPSPAAVDPTTGSAPADPFDEILTRGKKLYSQHDEELVIRHFFRDRRDGFFVDVGCYHYQEMSTTYYLEKHLGWSGIAVDALPYLKAGYDEHRPRTKFFNYIVTDHSGTVESFYAAGAVSSTDKNWAEENPEVQTEPKKIEVRTVTLNELLDMNEVSSVDFLSMDIEGGEPDALKGFDIERFRPRLVCIEVGNTPNEKLLQNYFERHGYRLLEHYLKYDTTNRYYAPLSGK